jgi:hypothetical protein
MSLTEARVLSVIAPLWIPLLSNGLPVPQYRAWAIGGLRAAEPVTGCVLARLDLGRLAVEQAEFAIHKCGQLIP